MKILIVGTGSIGRRHAENFYSLGCEIGAVDTNPNRLKEAALKVPLEGWLTLDDALHGREWDGIVIATPPAVHISELKECAVSSSCTAILMEKNLCLDYARCREFEEYGDDNGLLMGYTWRWWPNIADMQILLEKVGVIRQVQFTMSANLNDWHPYEPVEQFYAAERGGVLNEAHWHDIMLMLFGMPDKVWASFDKISNLPIETPDVLDTVFFYPDFRVNLHYDLYKRPHDRSMKVVGERGTLEWTPNQIRVSNAQTGGWSVYDSKAERNDMFLSMAQDFLGMIRGEVEPKCTMQDGINVMKLLELTKQSNESGEIVCVK